jgi:HD-GYP domain-containing protein (c-di-GMP phosphodiesterase class II)
MTPSLKQTEEARARRLEPLGRREFAAQAFVSTLFLATAGLLLALGPSRHVDALDLVLLVGATAALGRLEFEVGSAFTVPTQLVFVPMLFVLPPAIAPLAVASAHVLARLPAILARRSHPQRALSVLGNAWFSVGPALVFSLAHLGPPSLGDWPFYLLALAAQFAGDLGSFLLRVWLGRGSLRSQLRVPREVWLVDLLLSPVGLLAAYATVLQPRAYLLALPLVALLAFFARERRDRIDNAIELSAAYRGTALLLGDVLSTDDEYTGVHSQGVVALSLVIADELRIGEEERRLVEFGAMLHDIGKITTPKEILNKPGPLSVEEWELMREHTLAGQRLLDRVGGRLTDVGLIVRSSHERYDGGGYPDGLTGMEIPLAARIVSVADAYSAMTTRRSYREALPHEVAIAELEANAGTQFDPVVTTAAIRMLSPQPAAVLA